MEILKVEKIHRTVNKNELNWKSGYSELAELLVEKGANIGIRDNQGETALELALDRGKCECFFGNNMMLGHMKNTQKLSHCSFLS